jgi:hypothetical protein
MTLHLQLFTVSTAGATDNGRANPQRRDSHEKDNDTRSCIFDVHAGSGGSAAARFCSPQRISLVR